MKCYFLKMRTIKKCDLGKITIFISGKYDEGKVDAVTEIIDKEVKKYIAELIEVNHAL